VDFLLMIVSWIAFAGDMVPIVAAIADAKPSTSLIHVG